MRFKAIAIFSLAVAAVGAQAQNIPAFNEVQLIDVFVNQSSNGQSFTVTLGNNPMIISKHNDVGTITMIEGFYLLSDEDMLRGDAVAFTENGRHWEDVELTGNQPPFNVIGYSERNTGPGNNLGIHPGESVTFNFDNLSGFTGDFEDYGWRLRYGQQAAGAGQFVRAGAPSSSVPGPAAILPFLSSLCVMARRRRK